MTQSNSSRSNSEASYCAAYIIFVKATAVCGDSDEGYFLTTPAAAAIAESAHASDSWQQNVLSSTTNLLRQLCAIEHPSIRPF